MALNDTDTSEEFLRFQELIVKCQPITLEPSSTKEDRAVRANASKLKELTSEGHRKVANVILAASVRTERSVHKIEQTKQGGNHKLDQERQSFQAVNADLTDRWRKAFELSVPQKLYNDLSVIKDMSDTILREKDDLVKHLEQALETAETLNESQHQSQCDDLAELQIRMEQHYVSLQTAYRAELKSIDGAMLEDQSELVRKENTQLDQILNQTSELDDYCLKLFRNNAEEMEEKMNATDQHYYQNRQRIYTKLKDDVELLEEHLQSLRASCLLNGEKLDYGCQVLRQKQEEGVRYLSQQKRKINKLSDQYRSLKSAFSETTAKAKQEEGAMDKEIQSLKQNIEQFRIKAANILEAEQRKLMAVWGLENNSLNQLTLKLRELDNQIYNDILQRPRPLFEHHEPQHRSQYDIKNVATTSSNLAEAQLEKRGLLQTMAVELSFLLEPEVTSLIESIGCETDRELVLMDTLLQNLHITDATELDELMLHLQRSHAKAEELITVVTNFLEKKATKNDNVETKPVWDRSKEEITRQFQQYESVVSPETIQLWELLGNILVKYYAILKGRYEEAHKIYQQKSS